MAAAGDVKSQVQLGLAYLTGDGVAVRVVRHLAEHIFEPLLRLGEAAQAAA